MSSLVDTLSKVQSFSYYDGEYYEMGRWGIGSNSSHDFTEVEYTRDEYYRLTEQVFRINQQLFSKDIYVYGEAINGINVNAIEEVKLYPNPADESVFIEAPFNIEALSLITIQGELIFEKSGQLNERQISFGELPTGVYIAVIRREGKSTRQKLIIQHP